MLLVYLPHMQILPGIISTPVINPLKHYLFIEDNTKDKFLGKFIVFKQNKIQLGATPIRMSHVKLREIILVFRVV